MDAYYYSFDSTGVQTIDRILSAVACAGKAYHHTESWNNDTHTYEDWQRGESPVEWIQNSAADAAIAYLEGQKCMLVAMWHEQIGDEAARAIAAETMENSFYGRQYALTQNVGDIS